MRVTLGLLALCLVAGCSITPPKPKQCDGEFRPVNAPTQESTTQMSHAQSLALCTKGVGNGHHG
jgi:hypothetical protein